MLKKVITVTPTTLIAAVAVKQLSSDSNENCQTQPEELNHYNCRPSDLPIYTPLHERNKQKLEHHPEKKSAAREALESGISVVRSEVQSGLSLLEDQKKWIGDVVDTGIAHSQTTIDYLNEPQNTLARGGAIALGGLSGLLLAVRGGFVKKLIYTSTGAGVLAAICYPHKAEEYAKDTLYEARKGFAIAYNFAKGVKPGDEVPVEPINKFPTSLEDLKYLLLDLYDEAKEAISSKSK